MVLEATVVCIDNSEFMRNGDYPPSRLDAQQDAVTLICSAKISQNRESSVGLLTMAGKSARMLVTQTNDDRQILTSLHQVSVDGQSDFIAGIQTAQLALKHRQNQQQRQRIVVFVGSPIGADEVALKKVGKDLKKNGVAVDLISFGEEELNSRKLEEFFQTVDSGGNCHLVTVPTGPQILSDVLLRSPIVREDGGSSDVRPEAAGGDDIAVDPSVDPELVLALRISMEEERERQAREREAANQAAGGAPTAMDEEQTPLLDTTNVTDEDLYTSSEPKRDMQIDAPAPDSASANLMDDEDMDENTKLAIEISLQEQAEASKRNNQDKSEKDGEEKQG